MLCPRAPASSPATSSRWHAVRRAGRSKRSTGSVLAPALTPRLRWDDMVLPAPTREALEEIAFEAGARLRLLAEPEPGRLFARNGGLAALFSGPSGTGKTMAAEAIADRLGADLLIVDLAATVSKYIGETAKNLSRVFDEAAGAGCILLFDEADALFAKRTEIKDSHDRYANTDTNHLLQLLEGFDGLASLLDALADQHELTAAQIKNAMLTARYAAMREGGPINAEQIRRGLGRELIKDGRP